jgi:hypothetical protein
MSRSSHGDSYEGQANRKKYAEVKDAGREVTYGSDGEALLALCREFIGRVHQGLKKLMMLGNG